MIMILSRYSHSYRLPGKVTAGITITLLFTGFFNILFAQDMNYARSVVDTLAAPGMHGRGYVEGGDKVAAAYIENEFTKFGLKPFGESYRQEFSMSVNTFPMTPYLFLGKEMKPGADFIVNPSSPNAGTHLRVKLKTAWFDSAVVSDEAMLKRFMKKNLGRRYIVVDRKGVSDKDKLKLFDAMETNPLNAYGVIVLNNKKLTWSVSRNVSAFPSVEVLVPDSLHSIFRKSATASMWIYNEFIPDYKTQNIIGYIPGTKNPDSFIVFSAHYDHLGRMGKNVYFPGANDNASGMAMLLNLAKYYSQNKPEYSVAFMAFGAEEAGLVGSKYYTENPLFPLEKIRFMINMDLAGTGDEGITVVNGSVFNDEYKYLVKLNAQEGLLKEVKPRGKAANSDHYFFTEKGVKAFFIYTMGGIKAYHDIYDRAETLPLTEFEDYFKLLTGFSNYLMND